MTRSSFLAGIMMETEGDGGSGGSSCFPRQRESATMKLKNMCRNMNANRTKLLKKKSKVKSKLTPHVEHKKGEFLVFSLYHPLA